VMSYGANTLDAYREVGIYAGRRLSACCCAAVCCESDGWLQAEMRAAPAMAPTNAHFGNATRLADLGSWLFFFFGCSGPPARLQCPPYCSSRGFDATPIC
jgi:hypothetical protein